MLSWHEARHVRSSFCHFTEIHSLYCHSFLDTQLVLSYLHTWHSSSSSGGCLQTMTGVRSAPASLCLPCAEYSHESTTRMAKSVFRRGGGAAHGCQVGVPVFMCAHIQVLLYMHVSLEFCVLLFKGALVCVFVHALCIHHFSNTLFVCARSLIRIPMFL